KIKFDVIIFDLGLSSNQLDNRDRGFSFKYDGPLDMVMGSSSTKASDIINSYPEEQLANIIYKFGDERLSRRIAKNIVKSRKIKFIMTTKELAKLIKQSFTTQQIHKSKIHPATKTFQALRIYVNDELNELSLALNKSINLLSAKGRLIIVSFQSLEDRIVKDFFNHNSGKRWRSSRHYPELVDEGPITFNIITKKPIRPSEREILNNPRSRSAKLRVGEKIH
ncbi:MAG: Ribosomal RNA small subunit methyltransferase H, partial [Alphaproteobacteria bacterium MarineAlpha5_Bin2]